MLRQVEQEDLPSTSLPSRIGRFRRPSNATPSPSAYAPVSPIPSHLQSTYLAKHSYLSPEERRFAVAAWSDASVSPLSSSSVSPAINYDRDLPQLPPEALSEIDFNQLASRDAARTDNEVRSRHLSQYEPYPSPITSGPPSASSTSSNRAEQPKLSMAAHRIASASTSAAVSAGLGLKKLGKKASAARLRRNNTSQQAQERDASYADLRAGSSRRGTEDASVPMSGAIGSSSHAGDDERALRQDPYGADTFVDCADPAIGLPYDISHNVHVDVGPQGYTGLPASWAQILLSEGMDQQEICQDPEAAAKFVEDKIQHYVQLAVEDGADADETRRILSQRLEADDHLSAAVASARRSQPNRPRRDSAQSNASSSYSSVLEKGWDLSSHPKEPAPKRFPTLPAKSPLLPDFAAEDYDDWATSLLSSIPDVSTNKNGIAPNDTSKQAARADHRRSRSLTRLAGSPSLNGLGIDIAADATPRRTIQRQNDPLSSSNATPKASHRLQASIDQDAEHMVAAYGSATNESARNGEDERQERLRESFEIGTKDLSYNEEDEDDVEHVQIAQAAIATKGILRPVRASQLSSRKVSPSAVSLDFGSPRSSTQEGTTDLQARSARSPQYSDDSRPPSSQSNSRISRSGSVESFATAGSRGAFPTRGSFSNAPPRIYTEKVSTVLDREATSSPLETSSSGHSSFRKGSLTVATSSLGHASMHSYSRRTTPSPGLSPRDSVSPEVPPKDSDWRARSPALSVSASESGDGASSPHGSSHGWRQGRKDPSSMDSSHTSGHQTQESWASTANSIASSDGSHNAARGLGLRERRQAPPRIYPPSSSTRWAHMNHHDDGSGRRSSQPSTSPSPIVMQRKASADSLPARSPMSDLSPSPASYDSRSQNQHQNSGNRSSVRSAQSDSDAVYLVARDAKQQQLSPSISPTTLERRSPSAGTPSPTINPRFLLGRQRAGSAASARDSLPPPPPPLKQPTVVVRRQPEFILPGADGFYKMPSSGAAAPRAPVGGASALLQQDRLRPPPLSTTLPPPSPTQSDYHVTITAWMNDDSSLKSPTTITCEDWQASVSPSTKSPDSPLPPIPTEEDEADTAWRRSPFTSGSSSPAPESTRRQAKAPSPKPEADARSQTSSQSGRSVTSDRAPRLKSIVSPRLGLSGSLRDLSRFASDDAPRSPGEMEVLDDDASGAGRTSTKLSRDGSFERIGDRARSDTRSIVSIGPRAQENARRLFPVSMHYASGFDTASMLGDDSEAIRSFRELMLARQSMDLDDVLPMHMGGVDAPPVPALPSMKDLEAKVVAADQARAEDAMLRQAIAKSRSDSPRTESPVSPAALSLAGFETVEVAPLPPKLAHLSQELDLQPLRKDVLQDMEMIGDGESGPVFSASDVVKKRGVAVKVVKFSSNVDEEPSALLVGLVKEVRVWRRCRHVNVLDLYSLVLADNAIWIIQELAERSLADVIAWKDSGVDLNESRMSRVMYDLVQALQFLHSKGVLHRDVRSDNVMISSTGVCKLSDFTHAGELGGGVTSRHSVIGTPYWMAPEVIKADSYDMRCDVWSLGVVLWEMIEGDPPRVDFPPLRAITLTATLGLPALRDPGSLSHELKSFLHWATEMDAEKRPSAETLAMSDFLSDPCSRASIVALLNEAKSAELEAARLEEEENKGKAGEEGNMGGRKRDSWSSDSTTKG